MYEAALDVIVPNTGSVMLPMSILKLLAACVESLVRLVTSRSKVFIPTLSMDSSGSSPSPMVLSFSMQDVTAGIMMSAAAAAAKVLLNGIFSQ